MQRISKEVVEYLTCHPNDWTCTFCALPQLNDSYFFEQNDHLLSTPNSFEEDVDSTNNIYHDLSVMKQAHPNNIQIGHLNINSMGGFKMFELKEILASNCFAIFVVGETKLDSTFPTSQIAVPGYKVIRKDRNKHGGGLVVYVRSSIVLTRLAHLETRMLETIIFKVYFNKKYYLLIAAYRPPSLSKSTWSHEIQSILDTTALDYPNIIIIGDLNCDLMSQSNNVNPDTLELNDICDIYDMDCIIKEPTRVTNVTSTLIDVILTTIPQHFLTSGTIDTYILCDESKIG